MMKFLNLMNNDPCNGFVKKSAIISIVGQYCILISLLLTLSLIKKYLTLMWRVLFPLDALPFCSRRIALLLSWFTSAESIENPCPVRKLFVQIICGITSCRPTSSHLVELRATIFCLLAVAYMAPLPNDRIPPVWPFIVGCTAYVASTHHCVLIGSSASKVSVRYLVCWRYFRTLANFFSSSWSGCCTLVHKNDIAVRMSGRPCWLRKSSWATRWWNRSDSSLVKRSRSVWRTLNSWCYCFANHVLRQVLDYRLNIVSHAHLDLSSLIEIKCHPKVIMDFASSLGDWSFLSEFLIQPRDDIVDDMRWDMRYL